MIVTPVYAEAQNIDGPYNYFLKDAMGRILAIGMRREDAEMIVQLINSHDK